MQHPGEALKVFCFWVCNGRFQPLKSVQAVVQPCSVAEALGLQWFVSPGLALARLRFVLFFCPSFASQAGMDGHDSRHFASEALQVLRFWVCNGRFRPLKSVKLLFRPVLSTAMHGLDKTNYTTWTSSYRLFETVDLTASLGTCTQVSLVDPCRWGESTTQQKIHRLIVHTLLHLLASSLVTFSRYSLFSYLLLTSSCIFFNTSVSTIIL